jgi:hypothetical protein
MPFTASHVAAVLPVAGTALPVSALVVGSMSPDIPYYLPVGPWTSVVGGEVTHSLLGVLVVAPLLGLVVLVLWHGILARPAVALAPDALRQRLPRLATLTDRVGSARALALTWVALTIGAATHVAWDEFTHEDRWGATHLALLGQPVSWLPGDLPGYEWAQHISTVLGLVVVSAWIVVWWRRTPPSVLPQPGLTARARGSALLAIGGAGMAVALLASVGRLGTTDTVNSTAFVAITRGTTAAAVVALSLAVAWHLTPRVRAQER